MTTTTWAVVPNTGGRYEVSDDGRVRSLSWTSQMIRNGRMVPKRKGGAELVVTYAGNGYGRVGMSTPNGKVKVAIHTLVMLAFVGSRPAGKEVRHIDGDKRNNSLANLAYGTPVENARDREAHGTQPRGEKSAGAKLTFAAVAEIRLRSRPIKEEAARWGVSLSAISHVRARRSWRHVA